MGVCFRLYTEDAFNEMAPTGQPEILRCSLTSSILSLKTLGQNLEELDLMDKPDRESSMSFHSICLPSIESSGSWLGPQDSVALRSP